MRPPFLRRLLRTFVTGVPLLGMPFLGVPSSVSAQQDAPTRPAAPAFRADADVMRAPLEPALRLIVLTRRVSHVLDGLPAAAAGARPGDLVLALDGRPITAVTDSTWRAALGGTAPVHVRVRRDDAELDLRWTPKAVGF